MTKRIIFQLGTNNWQRGEEFAPGSGILHEAHHHAYNGMDNTVCYSVYPSTTQTSDDPRVTVYSLDHEVPICESISPVSSYRFHSMTEQEFNDYRDNLEVFVENAINDCEEKEGAEIELAVAHHTFLNPWVLANINARRTSSGRNPFKILCFVHGTALKMYAHEKAGVDPEYPGRFLPMVNELGLFSEDSPIHACAAISNEQLDKFADIFAEYPAERMILSPNGYNASVFKPDISLYRNREAFLAQLPLVESPCTKAPEDIALDFDKLVVFCGKFADWKRLDAVLRAATHYEESTNAATIVIGSGPEDAVKHYHSMAYDDLGLKKVYFVGPQQHEVIAGINAIADVGVYPSRNEPFGLVFIEAMGCGTPVIGCNSGGPRDFVDDTVGCLIPECEGDELSDHLAEAIMQSLDQNWKQVKGQNAATTAIEKYSVATQCSNLLESVDECLKNSPSFSQYPELLRKSILY